MKPNTSGIQVGVVIRTACPVVHFGPEIIAAQHKRTKKLAAKFVSSDNGKSETTKNSVPNYLSGCTMDITLQTLIGWNVLSSRD
jgi:hypothetical protein